MSKKVVILVSNDLEFDQRVNKISQTLLSANYEVLVLGRFLSHSKQNPQLNFNHIRFKLWFNSGPLFYANLNFRFLIFLLFNKFEIIHANDLDTLPAAAIAKKVKNTRLVYDMHELFTDVPELLQKPKVRAIWNWLEMRYVKYANVLTTVNYSMATVFEKRFNKKVIPIYNYPNETSHDSKKQSEKIILYQGRVNKDRGVEEIIEAMANVEGAQLWVVGDGDKLNSCKKIAQQLELSHKIKFYGHIPYAELETITRQAWLGVSIEILNSKNYLYSSPNKLYDYIQSNVPFLATDRPELKPLKDQMLGFTIHEVTPKVLSQKINEILNNNELYTKVISNIEKHKKEYTWQSESKKLLKAYESLR